jgi:3-oxoacyl-[acyl-carrier protein] reductase
MNVASLLDLGGRVAVVTGASAGIGAGIARRLGEAGAAVAVHYRGGAADAGRVADGIRAAGGRAMAVHAELTDPDAVRAAFAEVEAGLGPVDILVNNAAKQTHSTIAGMDPDEFRTMMATNLDAVFNATQGRHGGHGGARRRRRDRQHRLDRGPLPGAHPPPLRHDQGRPHHVHARAAALEFGRHGIRVNAVSPGVIYRDGILENWPDGVKRWMDAVPLGRMGEDDDVANAVLYLVAPASGFVTGANIVVDGGMTATSAF